MNDHDDEPHKWKVDKGKKNWWKKNRETGDKDEKLFREFREYLLTLDFHFYEIAMDGNCLFWSRAHQHGGNVDSYDKYRQVTVEYEREKRTF